MVLGTALLVDGQSENIPNPETNGDITIQFAMYPDTDMRGWFLMYPSTIQILFSKQNMSQFNIINLPNEGIKPSAYKGPTTFSFEFYVEIPIQPQSDTDKTTLIKHVSGYFNIYKVQEFPQVNEQYTYGRGSINVGNATWFNGEGVYMESLSQQPIYGMILTGRERLS
jgi:hypothetical protein